MYRNRALLTLINRHHAPVDNLAIIGQADAMAVKIKRAKLSDQVRRAIEDSGETRYQIAKKTGLDDSALCRFMSGERGLSTKALDIVAEYLELSIVSSRKPVQRK